MALTRTTKLQAVNTMLSAIGESPINSLSNVTAADAISAISILGEISREVQSTGFGFNTEYDFPLIPNNDGEIIVAQNVVRVDLEDQDYWQYDVQLRGNRLYEKNERTFKFAQTLRANVVKLLEFDELPELCSRYITIRAARVFANRYLGAQEINVYTQEEEFKARAAFMDAEVQDSDYNMISSRPNFMFRTFRPSDVIVRRW